jgi:hypothetical protein
MKMEYRKRPVVVEAIQWNGNNLSAIINFTGLHPSARNMAWSDYVDLVKRDGLKIFSLEGKMSASIGDWIIKGVNGEFYPCKPDIFEKIYEPECATLDGKDGGK